MLMHADCDPQVCVVVREHHSSPKWPRGSEKEFAGGEFSGHCKGAALTAFKGDLLGQHDVSDRQISPGQETQPDLRATIFVDLADVRRGSGIDPVSVASVAADHVEIAAMGVLRPLRRREPTAKELQRAPLWGALCAMSNVESLRGSHSRALNGRDGEKRKHDSDRLAAD